MDYEECKSWYDGYRQHGFEIYNSVSIIEAMETKRFDSYWSQTASYEGIADRIRMNFAGTKGEVLKMIAGKA